MTDIQKIYNDAPDEFAEFLDSGAQTVTLEELGGKDNPFIKAGIYKQIPVEECKCDTCDINTLPGLFLDGEEEEEICGNCRAKVEAKKKNPDYAIDHSALADFISKGIGCTISRQFKKTGWLFGSLRGYDVYFACVPTPGMYHALEASPKSILIIGMNTPKSLPEKLAPRVIDLSRLLYVKDAKLNFAMETIEEKIPQEDHRPRRYEKRGHTARRQSRPSIHVYAPMYLTMIRNWICDLHEKNTTGTPSVKYVNGWMRRNCKIDGVEPVGEWQTRRHLDVLCGKKECENIDPTFSIYWNGCSSPSFISENYNKDISKTIINLFKVADRTGFKVSPMRNMDAAEYADKVAQR